MHHQVVEPVQAADWSLSTRDNPQKASRHEDPDYREVKRPKADPLFERHVAGSGQKRDGGPSPRQKEQHNHADDHEARS